MRSFFALSFLACSLPALASDCRILGTPIHVHDEPNLETWQLDLGEAALGAGPSEGFRAARALARWLTTLLPGLDPFDQSSLLRRQRDIFVKYFGAGAAERFDLLLEGRGGSIGAVGCVESLLLDFHFTRRPRFEEPSEFAAVGIRAPGSDELVVYLSSSKGMSVPSSPWLQQRFRAHRREGAEFLFHLHNHPFVPDNPAGDWGGTVVPSGERGTGGDLGSYARMTSEYGLREFWITNSFSTFRASTADLGLFP